MFKVTKSGSGEITNNTIALGNLLAYPTPCTVEERGIIRAAKINVTVHKGGNSMIPDDAANHIIQVYEQLCECGIAVCSRLLAIELQRFSPQLNQLSLAILRRHVLCLMKRNNITHQCVTHKAQNIHVEQPIIVDFTRYINRQIVSGRYSANVIINVDETNVDFDPCPRTTLCRIGDRSVKACISGHLGRCTVVLACTMSGIKLPALVIWRGVPNGRIDREIHGPLYLHENGRHAVQVKGWLDSDKYQAWIREVLSVYLNG
jgi:hypothetical protein